MDGAELQQFVPELLEGRFPGRWRQLDPEKSPVPGVNLGWAVDLDDCVALVRAPQVSNPFIWIRAGVAHTVPRTPDLAIRVAAGNKDLMVGRLYLASADGFDLVVFDESIVGAYLSLDYQPSIVDTVNRLENGLRYAASWSETIIAEFGGRRFGAGDWALLSF